jgi:CAAX protease family protein
MNKTLLTSATTRRGIIVPIQNVARTAPEAAYPSKFIQVICYTLARVLVVSRDHRGFSKSDAIGVAGIPRERLRLTDAGEDASSINRQSPNPKFTTENIRAKAYRGFTRSPQADDRVFAKALIRLIVRAVAPDTMPAKSPQVTAPFWFGAVLAPMVASQILRLHQSDAASWIFRDYAGRLGALTVLAVIPSPRMIAFGQRQLRMTVLQTGLRILGIVLVDHFLCGWIRRTIDAMLPATVLDAYPESHGWLHIFDDTFGLALVAYSEEMVFRRCAHHVFTMYFGDGSALVLLTSLSFAAYHWWTGIGNIAEALIMGVLLMLFYRRSTALWSVVLAHSLTDVADFAL